MPVVDMLVVLLLPESDEDDEDDVDDEDEIEEDEDNDDVEDTFCPLLFKLPELLIFL
jgi:hypothetical protein